MIIGWNTPDGFSAINAQSETTLHNIHGIHNLIRGLSPLPGAQSRINGKKIKILETRIIENIFHILVLYPK